MAITSWNGQQAQPSVAYGAPADGNQPGQPGSVDAGFQADSSFDVPPQLADQAAIDRHVTAADATGPDESGTGSPSAGRAQPSRHII
jgi:hypothetical protein